MPAMLKTALFGLTMQNKRYHTFEYEPGQYDGRAAASFTGEVADGTETNGQRPQDEQRQRKQHQAGQLCMTAELFIENMYYNRHRFDQR